MEFLIIFSRQVIDGNMIIKMAVKDTPTLLGNKLKQYYFKVIVESHYAEELTYCVAGG